MRLLPWSHHALFFTISSRLLSYLAFNKKKRTTETTDGEKLNYRLLFPRMAVITHHLFWWSYVKALITSLFHGAILLCTGIFWKVWRSELVAELRRRLEGAQRRLTAAEAEHGDTSAALREQLALRASQLAALNEELLQAKRTIVEQEVQNDYLQQRLEERGDSPPPEDASQLTTARLSAGTASDSRLTGTERTVPPATGQSDSRLTGTERTVPPATDCTDELRREAATARQQVSLLTAQRQEAARTADMLRTELRVALEALQNQRRETDLRLLSSSDTRLHELGHMEQQNRELRALSTRWQLRAEASERQCRAAAETLEQERAKRLEMEASLAEASCRMREIQEQLQRQDQYSTWAKLNQSLQLKQFESVMLSLLKVAPRSVGDGTNSVREAAPPSAGGGEATPPAGDAAGCSVGSLASTEAEGGTDTEPERFQPLPDQPCDSSGETGDPLTEI